MFRFSVSRMMLLFSLSALSYEADRSCIRSWIEGSAEFEREGTHVYDGAVRLEVLSQGFLEALVEGFGLGRYGRNPRNMQRACDVPRHASGFLSYGGAQTRPVASFPAHKWGLSC